MLAFLPRKVAPSESYSQELSQSTRTLFRNWTITQQKPKTAVEVGTCLSWAFRDCSTRGMNSEHFRNTRIAHLTHSHSLLNSILSPVIPTHSWVLSNCVLVSWATLSQESAKTSLRNSTSNQPLCTLKAFDQISAFTFCLYYYNNRKCCPLFYSSFRIFTAMLLLSNVGQTFCRKPWLLR